MRPGKRTALVTGARTGVGLALTQRLLAEGWDVAVLVRSPITDAPDVLAAEAAGQLRTYRADLSDFQSLRGAVQEIARKEPSIDVLFNNAAVGPGELLFSAQDRELCFEVNTVVPYVLTRALAPNVANSQLKRVVHTSSNALLYVKSFEPKGLAHPTGKFRPLLGAYAHSKLALSLWTQALADELSTQGISSVSACPGPNKTPLTASAGMPWPLGLVARFFFKPPSVGADKIHNAALGSPRVPDGSFLNKGKVTPLPFAHSAQAVLDEVHGIYQREFTADTSGREAGRVHAR